MKLEPEELDAIKTRHRADAAIYTRIGDPGWKSHQDRERLLAHIENRGPGDAFGTGCGAALGKWLGTFTVWGFFYWLLQDDIAKAAAWLVQHVRFAP